MTNETVDIQEVTINPDNAGFGTGASDIIVPKTTNMFGKSSGPSFAAGLLEDDKPTPEVSANVSIGTNAIDIPKTATTFLSELKEEVAETPAEENSSHSEEVEDPEVPKDRTKSGKDSMVAYLKAKIEAKEFDPYDDYDEKQPLEDYLYSLSEKDRNKLLDSNLEAKDQKRLEELRTEVFQSLPGSLQYVAHAVANGATEHDLQDLYTALLRVEQTKALDITDENDQESIAYSYLQATNWGTQQEIQDQVTEWKNDGKLEGKVKQFKPKLDQMQEQQIQYQLQQQEEYNRQQQELQQYYTQSIYNTLKKGEIGGLKLDKRKQQEFYDGLTNVRVSPLSQKPVNSLGARLEEIQFSDKPDFDLLMEVNWLLNDKEGYRNALIQLGKNEGAVETERKLKSAQQTTSKGVYEEPEQPSIKKKGIAKQRNIFA